MGKVDDHAWIPGCGPPFKAEHLPSLSLSLEVTRGQFSDMLRMLEGNRLKDLQFTVEDGTDGSWPVNSGGMTGETGAPQ